MGCPGLTLNATVALMAAMRSSWGAGRSQGCRSMTLCSSSGSFHLTTGSPLRLARKTASSSSRATTSLRNCECFSWCGMLRNHSIADEHTLCRTAAGRRGHLFYGVARMRAHWAPIERWLTWRVIDSLAIGLTIVRANILHRPSLRGLYVFTFK